MDDGNRAISGINRSQNGKHDCMVPTECDNARVMFPIHSQWGQGFTCNRVVLQGRVRLTVEERLVTALNLLNRDLVIIRAVDLPISHSDRTSKNEITHVTGMSPQSTILRPDRKGLC